MEKINGSHMLDGSSMSKFWQMNLGKEGGTLGMEIGDRDWAEKIMRRREIIYSD
jgi:hypothetical protein